MDADQWEGLFALQTTTHQNTTNNENLIQFHDTKDINDEISTAFTWDRLHNGNEASQNEYLFDNVKTYRIEQYETVTSMPWNFMEFYPKSYNCCGIDLDILLFQILDTVYQVI